MAARILLDANGCKVSKPGIDVLSASQQDQYAFNSEWKGYGVYMAGTFLTSTTANAYTEITFPSLGYVPYAIVSSYTVDPAVPGASFTSRLSVPTGFGGGAIHSGFRFEIGDGKLRVFKLGSAGISLNMRYILFYNPA